MQPFFVFKCSFNRENCGCKLKNWEKINIPFWEIEYDEEWNQIQKYVNFYNNVWKNEYYYDWYFNIHLDSKYKNNIYKINIYYNKNWINELEKSYIFW